MVLCVLLCVCDREGHLRALLSTSVQLCAQIDWGLLSVMDHSLHWTIGLAVDHCTLSVTVYGLL